MDYLITYKWRNKLLGEETTKQSKTQMRFFLPDLQTFSNNKHLFIVILVILIVGPQNVENAGTKNLALYVRHLILLKIQVFDRPSQ